MPGGGRPEAFMRSGRWRREATALERTRRERKRGDGGGEEGVRNNSPSRFFRWKIAEMGEDNVNDVFALWLYTHTVFVCCADFYFCSPMIRCSRAEAECMPESYHNECHNCAYKIFFICEKNSSKYYIRSKFEVINLVF